MPIARGIMQIGRISIYETTTTILSFDPPSPSPCGFPIEVSVEVQAVDGPTPTGTVSIIDVNSGDTISVGSLTGGIANINIELVSGNYSLKAVYNGTSNFKTSESSPTAYNTIIVPTSVSFDNIDTDFCADQPFNINWTVVPLVGGTDPVGTINFYLYFDDVSFISLGSAQLSSGSATLVIPGGTVSSDDIYYVQGIYDGYGCFSTSSSPPGIDGYAITAVADDVTNLTISISSTTFPLPYEFCYRSTKTFTVNVNATNLPDPSIGSVLLRAWNGSSYINLGTKTPVNGVCTYNVAPNTFAEQFYWLQAIYTSAGGCYADSSTPGTTSGTLISPKLAPVTIIVSGTTTFCRNQIISYTAQFSSTTTGILSGTGRWYLYRTSAPTTPISNFATTTITGPTSGINFARNLPANTASNGDSYFVRVTFTGDSTGCFGNGTSANYNLNIKASNNQSTNTTVSVSPSPSSGNSNTNWTFTIRATKGGSAVGSAAGTATLFHSTGGSYTALSSSINMVEFSTFSQGTYSTNMLVPGVINYFIARFNGNTCFPLDDSPVLSFAVAYPPPH